MASASFAINTSAAPLAVMRTALMHHRRHLEDLLSTLSALPSYDSYDLQRLRVEVDVALQAEVDLDAAMSSLVVKV